MYTDSKTGRGAAPQGGSVHGYDDKRDQNLDEFGGRLAGRVLQQLQKLTKAEKAPTGILAASARMRRFLDPDLDTLTRQGDRVHKVSKNMVNFSPQKIHEHLAEDGFVPRQKKA